MLQIGLAKLTVKQLDYLGEQTIAISVINSNEAVHTNPLYVQVKETHEKYRQVVMKQTYSGLGEDLANEDLRRDRYHSGFIRIIDGYVAFDDSPRQAPAQILQKALADVNTVYKLNYAEESVVIKKMIEKLHEPENMQAVLSLGIEREMQMLIEAQNAFDALYIEQLNVNSDLRQQSSASGMRKELENALRSYFGLVSAMSTIEPWQDIYSDLKELLKKF